MSHSLTAYTNKQEIATQKDAFKSFMALFGKLNPKLSDTDTFLIKECIDDDKIRIGELEKAIKQAYKDPDRYGKVEWNHIWKWVQHNRNNKVIDGGTW